VCGVGLWVCMSHSSTIGLYHTESFIHMQDINIASNVSKVLDERGVTSSKRLIYVTSMSATKGILWVGTNVGIALTIPLPRLEGVPIISGKANISFHAHFGPVRMFLSLQSKVHTTEQVENNADQPLVIANKSMYKKQLSEGGSPSNPTNSQFHKPSLPPSAMSSKTSLIKKSSKTLPRGFVVNNANETAGESVFGLYGDLMNVEEYECDGKHSLDGSRKDMNKSDPELDTIGYKNTLDRRVVMKSQRPRSLDLSTWSVMSGESNNTSSSDTGSPKSSPSVSRTTSCASNSNASQSSDNTNNNITPNDISKTLTKDGQCGKEETNSKNKTTKSELTQRTITTLMGGRGYIQWRGPHLDKKKTDYVPEVNNSDAFLVVWDHKL